MEHGEKSEQLWTGSSVEYDSHSEVDMALCCLLAVWRAVDRSQIDRLFQHRIDAREVMCKLCADLRNRYLSMCRTCT